MVSWTPRTLTGHSPFPSHSFPLQGSPSAPAPAPLSAPLSARPCPPQLAPAPLSAYTCAPNSAMRRQPCHVPPTPPCAPNPAMRPQPCHAPHTPPCVPNPAMRPQPRHAPPTLPCVPNPAMRLIILWYAAAVQNRSTFTACHMTWPESPEGVTAS